MSDPVGTALELAALGGTLLAAGAGIVSQFVITKGMARGASEKADKLEKRIRRLELAQARHAGAMDAEATTGQHRTLSQPDPEEVGDSDPPEDDPI